ncbi:MAG: bifunctional nuclease domain-containing protein [Candidatus Kapaibacterium sp.]
MDKIQLIVLGLSASPAGNNAYALILKEADGERRLPIIIGAFEAQAIALEMEGVMPPRPMTHDLMKQMMDAFGSTLQEVYINDLKDGTFYAKLIFDNLETELDARPSDAIALAVRCSAPVFVSNDILEETGLQPQAEEETAEEETEEGIQFLKKEEEEEPPKPKTKIEQLQDKLDKAVKEEDYEKAAQYRDEIKRILESS